MISRIVIVSLLFAGLSYAVMAQSGAERSALNNLKKQRWERVYDPLQKSIRKDSTNATARYILAQYFFSPFHPGYNIDSAYQYTIHALEDLQRSSAKERDRMKRVPLDSIILVHYRGRIDSAAFERARKTDTEQAYIAFLERFRFALQRPEAAALRDEAAYRDVLKINTHQAFQEYLTRYPGSARATEARERYEKLLYEAETRDKQLASYEKFLKRFPSSPHRREAEKMVFEISTASGEPASFETFLARHPENHKAPVAQRILYHLLPEEQRDNLPSCLRTDSLKQVAALERSYLVPVLHNDLFGFMDPEGKEVITPQAGEIDPAYRCGNITDDVLILSEKVVTRNGMPLIEGKVFSLDDLGNGFLLAGKTNCFSLFHKSGFRIGDHCLEDARLISGKFLALKKNRVWSLWTLTGRILLHYAWDNISSNGNIIIFQKGKGLQLATAAAVAAIARHQPLKLTNAFDEIRNWPDSLLWVRSGDLHGVLDHTLAVWINPDKGELTSTFFGASRAGQQTTLYDKKGNVIAEGNDVQVQYPWIALKSEQSWKVLDPKGHAISRAYDSICFKGPFAIGMKEDSVRVYFDRKVAMDLVRPVTLEFVPGQDSSAFMLIGQDDKKSLYDHKGRKLFAVPYHKVQHAGQDIFIVSKKEKKGLVSADGKQLLPAEYDAIGSIKDGMISLLRSVKFGYYDVSRKRLVKPEYSKNVVPYNQHVLTAFKDRQYGFIGWDNKPLSNFEFGEIRYWNDSAALVKKNSQWMIYEIQSKKVLFDKIRDYQLIRDMPDEKLAIIHQENNYGVLSCKKGIVIPITFSDIVNVGSSEVPLYFTEKHVEEASLFVVIYYTHHGVMLRKEVYEQEDYDKIYCSEKSR